MKRIIYLMAVLMPAMAGVATAQQTGGGFSLAGKYAAERADTALLVPDSTLTSQRRIYAYRITPTGHRTEAPLDTARLNTSTSTLMEGRGLAMAYTGNLASPAWHGRFAERPAATSDFIFADPYADFIVTPRNALFFDTRVPYTHALYTRSGGTEKREEQLKVLLTGNFGRRVNVGGEVEYIYGNGHYNSHANKAIAYRVFGSYRADRYEAYAHIRNFNIVQAENGGIVNERYITHPNEFNERNRRATDTKEIPTRYADTWNRVVTGNFLLTHRYNLGFYRPMTDSERERERQRNERTAELKRLDAEKSGGTADSNEAATDESSTEPPVDEVFVPVSSLTHTVTFDRFHRRFISNDTKTVDTVYSHRYFAADSSLNDYTEAWVLRNTVALSLREGFHSWAKFGLAAYIRFENRRYMLSADSVTRGMQPFTETGGYIGGELSKRRGTILTYNASGEFCFAGENRGEFRLDGQVRTAFRLAGREASISAEGYVHNLMPAFHVRRFRSRYYWWDQAGQLAKINRVYAGGTLSLPQTGTRLSAGIENLHNWIYFDTDGRPAQHTGSIQYLTGSLRQTVRYRALGWESEALFQQASSAVVPLPRWSFHTNLYLTFKYARVLTIQLGADAFYHTAYRVPRYNPATQQFQLQHEGTYGNYPLINAYANFHLKQARFFVAGYNLGTLFIDHPRYLSMPGYPLNPMVIKLGVAVMFNN